MRVTKSRGVIKFESEQNGSAYYSLGTGEMHREHIGKDILKAKSLQQFFSGQTMGNLLENCDDEGFIKFIKKVSYLESTCGNIGTFVARLHKYSNIEAYERVGIRTSQYQSYIVKTELKSIPKDIIAILVDTCIEQLFFKVTRENFDRPIRRDQAMFMDYIRYSYKRGGTDGVKCIIDRLEYYWNMVVELEQMGFNRNLLAGYIVYVDQTENVSYPVTLIRDHYKMSMDMHIISLEESGSCVISEFFDDAKDNGLTTNDALAELRAYYPFLEKIKTLSHRIKKIERYPRYLTSKHDIITKQYRGYKQVYDDIAFMKINKSNSNLLWGNKDYQIILPSTTNEIKAEAKDLAHCVASYIDNVIKKTTIIAFMRVTKKTEESLLTVEIKHGKIVQVRGIRNRGQTDDEHKFLVKFAKEKNLEYIR